MNHEIEPKRPQFIQTYAPKRLSIGQAFKHFSGFERIDEDPNENTCTFVREPEFGGEKTGASFNLKATETMLGSFKNQCSEETVVKTEEDEEARMPE